MVTIAFHMMVFTPVSHHKAVSENVFQLFASLILNTALLFIIVYCIYQYTVKVYWIICIKYKVQLRLTSLILKMSNNFCTLFVQEKAQTLTIW